MNVLVLHPSVNIGGGAERVCVSIIEGLKENGHNVTLATFDKPDWSTVEKYFGKVTQPDAEIVAKRFLGLSAYGEFLNFHRLFSIIKRKFDATIVSCTSPWFYCPPVEKVIIYMLPPMGYGTGLKHLYLEPYNFIQHRFLKKSKKKVILTNSIFSSEIIEDVYSLKPEILYPPVEIENFHSSPKENLIVSLGRFTPFKRFEVLINSMVDIDNARCIIMGNIHVKGGGGSHVYVDTLIRLIRKLRLEDRVDLFVNHPFDLISEILSKAKIYVHCAEGEHFGISVVEAMASGCVPVVHRSGGPYTDIIDKDRYGFSFERSSDLAHKLTLLLNNDELCNKYSQEAILRSKLFSSYSFKREFAKVLSKENIL
jgi:alpha-1,2-mannosyltransferase